MKKILVALGFFLLALLSSAAPAESHVKDSTTGQQSYEIDGNYVKTYRNGRLVLQIDGRVKDYSTSKPVLGFSGRYIRNYPTGERLLDSTGIIPRVVFALVVLGEFTLIAESGSLESAPV